MKGIMRIALKDLKKRWTLALVMALLFSVTFASYLSLITYQKSLSSTYFSLNANWLLVQASTGSGEVHGSRLTQEIGHLLAENGYDPIAEIHQVVGTSLANAIMMRGVRPQDLYRVSPFTLLKGRALEPGDAERLTMIGSSLAERMEAGVGDEIRLRGRVFTVIGIFKTGSYEDGQAWISLIDAQKLLNYGSDVSIYYIPDGGKLQEGDSIATGIAIGRRGDAGNAFGQEAMSFFNYLGLVGGLVGAATLITLSSLLWRLAWLHRREFGILRTLGFRRRSVVIYLLTQAGVIILSGAIIGAVFAVLVVISRIQSFSSFGISLTTSIDVYTISMTILITLVITGLSIAMPAARINRMSTPELLGRE